MTSGDPTAPKPTVPSRQASRAVAKKPGKPAKATSGTGASASKEPRVSVSKAGSGALKRIANGGSAGNDDVLERLARLGEAPVTTEPDEAIALPPIVEADPTFPPIERPVEARRAVGDDAGDPEPAAEPEVAEPEVADPAGRADPDAPTAGSTSSPHTLTASSSATLPASTVVSADLPTAAVAAPSADLGRPASARWDPSDPPTVAELPAVDRTEVVAAAPTELLLAPSAPPAPSVVPEPASPVPAPVVEPVAEPVVEPAADDGTGSVTLPLRRLKAPVVFRRAKPRVRRVTRVVRHVDTWSVFKVALVFNVILYLCCLTSGVLLWNVAHATGTIDNIEKFFEQFGWESFEFKGGEIYHNAWIGGLFVAVGLTGFAVLIATLFNLITDLVGGIRVSVLEEEVVAKPRQGDPTGGTPRP